MGLAVAQILVVLAGHVAGAWVLLRRTELPQRRPAILALGFLAVAASLAVTLT